MAKERKFWDIEEEKVYSYSELEYEYNALCNIAKIEGFEMPTTFGQYLANCLGKNGTLTEICTTKGDQNA